MTTTKRHPAPHPRARSAPTRDGRLDGDGFLSRFQHRRLCLLGPDGRQSRAGPRLRALSACRTTGREARAMHTHLVPAGAFRGFGVPQSALAQEQLFDELALKLGIDPLEFRILNALRAGEPTVTGQVFADGIGFRACLEALAPALARARAPRPRRSTPQPRARCGAASASPACGTAAATPRCRTPRPSALGLKPDGRVRAVSGRGRHRPGLQHGHRRRFAPTRSARRSTRFDLVGADTDMTPDCGKTSASRQTFVTGNAALLAGAGDAARDPAARQCRRGRGARFRARRDRSSRTPAASGASISRACRSNAAGFVVEVAETFDPPTTTLDENGQGEPYAVFGSGAHIAEVEVDIELGRVQRDCGSPARTTSAARSTRRWSKARSRAARRRGSASR